MTKNDAGQVELLFDRLAIHDLVCKYCDALDLRQWELLDEVFTADLVSRWPHGGAQGRDVTVRYIQKAFTWLGATHHQVGNLRVDFDGDSADVAARFRCHHRGAGDRSHLFEESLALFTFKAVRTPGGWRFSEIEERILVMLGDEDVFAGPDGSPTPLGQMG